MTEKKPGVDEVRCRVRSLATPQLLLIATGFGNVEISGPAPADAVGRPGALHDATHAELARRGLTVLPSPSPDGTVTYRGSVER